MVIGRKSFTKYLYNANKDGNNPNRHFYLKNCERLRELKIGNKSFMDYSVCEIDNANRLEVIKIGGLTEESGNFLFASLELKSDTHSMK